MFVAREDMIGAAHFLNAAHEKGYRARLVMGDAGALTVVVDSESAAPSDWVNDLAYFDFRGLTGLARWALTATLVACAQTLYRHGDASGSQSFLTNYQKAFGQHHVLTDIDLAQTRYTRDQEKTPIVIRCMAIGGLEYLDCFKGKFCRRPFNDFEVRYDGEVFSCCPSLLPYSLGNAFAAQSVNELKSSPMQAKIRNSIVHQDFRYCRWLHCSLIRDDNLPKATPNNRSTYEPTNFRLSYDPTCNLWCPSCRKEKITARGTQRDAIYRLTDQIVLPALKSAKFCMMNGYGDVFASKACRQILEAANPIEFPHLKFNFITNGILFTRAEWEKFPDIHSMVRSIRVSIDAAKRETYHLLRLGGDWDTLMDNLSFIAELRRTGTIKSFQISFFIQEDSFLEMEQFAYMGLDLGCNFVMFEPIMNWNTFPLETFKRKAVHYSTHPRHAQFKEELARVPRVLPLAAAAPNPENAGIIRDDEEGTKAWINF